MPSDYWDRDYKYERRQKAKMLECPGCYSLQFPGKCMRCGTLIEKPEPVAKTPGTPKGGGDAE